MRRNRLTVTWKLRRHAALGMRRRASCVYFGSDLGQSLPDSDPLEAPPAKVPSMFDQLAATASTPLNSHRCRLACLLCPRRCRRPPQQAFSPHLSGPVARLHSAAQRFPKPPSTRNKAHDTEQDAMWSKHAESSRSGGRIQCQAVQKEKRVRSGRYLSKVLTRCRVRCVAWWQHGFAAALHRNAVLCFSGSWTQTRFSGLDATGRSLIYAPKIKACLPSGGPRVEPPM